MIKFLYKINKKYGQIPEPKRFFIFVAIALPGLIMTMASHPGDTIGWIGFVYLVILLAVRASFMHGWLDSGKE